MPQCWDVIVPDALKGIKEVVVTHTKSKWGTIRTKERVVPTVLPKCYGRLAVVSNLDGGGLP
jgi:hypothetical protein